MGIRLTVVALGVVLVPRVLVAQDPRLADRLPAGAAMAVQRLVDSAAADSIPTEPLIRKALEGQSKGADSARIIAAVRALAGNLATARRALGSSAGEPELVAGAAALRAGAPATSLAALRGLRKRGPLAVPLSVYADLLSSGLPPDRAWNEVRDLASRDVPDSEFLALRDRVTGRTAPASTPLPPGPRSPPDPLDPSP